MKRSVLQLIFLLALASSFPFAAHAVDTDGDGVPDNLDPCPNLAYLDCTFSGSDTVYSAPPGKVVMSGMISAGEMIQVSDGKLVITGSRYHYNNYFAIARFNLNGSLDTSFNSTGFSSSNYFGYSLLSGNFYEYGERLIEQSDKKLVQAGTISSASSATGIPALMRYNQSGTLDTTFGDGGKLPGGAAGGLTGVIEDSNHHVVISGRSYLVSHNVDGSINTGFGGGTGVITTCDNAGMVFTQVGAIVVACLNGQYKRYDEAGTLTGQSNSSLPVPFAASAITQQLDGKWVIAGDDVSKAGMSEKHFALIRYNSDGSLDTTFNTTGMVTTAVGSYSDHAADVIQQADGKLVVVGSSAFNCLGCISTQVAAARYNPDGSLDASFAQGGKLLLPNGGLTSVEAATSVIQQKDGKLSLLGVHSSSGLDVNATVIIWRLAMDPVASSDTDGDGVDNLSDNCPAIANADQTDSDGDGAGNACDATPNGDDDNDGVDNLNDNCPLIANADQIDTDGDGIGNACDTTPNGDTDGDGVDNLADNCPLNLNSDQADTDADGLGNACDSTPNGDTDNDNDGVDNLSDNCPVVANSDQTDTDGDGTGNACDATPNGDDDNDGVDNLSDNCPAVANADQKNTDGDSAGDACDSTPNGDSDGDGIDNLSDILPNNPYQCSKAGLKYARAHDQKKEYLKVCKTASSYR